MKRKQNWSSKASKEAFFLSNSKGGVVKIDVVSILMVTGLLLAIYLTFLIAPLVWKKQELISLVKEFSYSVKKAPHDDRAKEILVELAQSQLGIALEKDDIEIHQLENRVMIKVLWKPRFRILTGQLYALPMEITQHTPVVQ